MHGETTYTSPVVIAKALVAKTPALAGSGSAAQEAAVTQWLSWAFSDAAQAPGALETLDKHLAGSNYVAGNAYTVADAAVYYSVHAMILSAGPVIAKQRHLARWVRQFVAEPGYASVATSVGAPGPAPKIPAAPPVKLSVGAGKAAAAVLNSSSESKPAEAAAAGSAPASSGEGKKDKKAEKADKKDKKDAAASGSAAVAAPAPAAAAAEEDWIGQCDIRVGLITKAWVHPEATKLYCEEIDIGEPTGPRQIASGLREHYTLEQMQGRRVVIIANLKPRPLVGFMSAGMVLCATSAEGKVEFVTPPEGAKVGERVAFAGHSGEAADPKKVRAFHGAAPISCVSLHWWNKWICIYLVLTPLTDPLSLFTFFTRHPFRWTRRRCGTRWRRS